MVGRLELEGEEEEKKTLTKKRRRLFQIRFSYPLSLLPPLSHRENTLRAAKRKRAAPRIELGTSPRKVTA